MTTHENEMMTNGATTTEELIVQYLDGELVRKELEVVLFERLSHSEEARMLLREYLVVRGAIRVSREDERFQLSEGLDDRTRVRLEQLLESITEKAEPARFLDDRPAVQTIITGRRMKRWVLRPSVAALVLLLAIGTTWLVTHTADDHAAPHQMAAAPQQSSIEAPQTIAPTPTAQPEQPATEVVTKTHSTHHAVLTQVRQAAAPSYAQNAASAQAKPAAQPEQTTNPEDVMLSRRYTKILNAAEKREIVVSSRDRL